MASTMTALRTSATTKGGDAAAELAPPLLQNLKKCRYCNYEHWDEFDLRFHEEMHKEYCEEKRRSRAEAAIIRSDTQ